MSPGVAHTPAREGTKRCWYWTAENVGLSLLAEKCPSSPPLCTLTIQEEKWVEAQEAQSVHLPEITTDGARSPTLCHLSGLPV